MKNYIKENNESNVATILLKVMVEDNEIASIKY